MNGWQKWTKKIHALAHSEPAAAKRLLSIPGIGPINATAFFGSGRWQTVQARTGHDGLVGANTQTAFSGGKDRLLGISKRGDTYLRTLLIHGARSALKAIDKKTDPRSQWFCKTYAADGIKTWPTLPWPTKTPG